MRSTIVVLALALGLVPFASPAEASTNVYVLKQYEPTRIAVHEGGYYQHVSLHDLTWSGWNQATAVGRGVYTFQFCVPGNGPCADAAFYDEPALVTLGGVVTCRGRAYYTELDVTNDGTVMNSLSKPFHVSLGSCAVGRSRKHG